MWWVSGPLYLGDLRSGELALEACPAPRHGVPFAGVLTLCAPPAHSPLCQCARPGGRLLPPKLEWLSVPIPDGEKGAALLEDAVALAVPFLARCGRQGPVLVHCLAGRSRSAAIAAAYLCEVEGMALPVALELIQDARQAIPPVAASLEIAGGEVAPELLRALRRSYPPP